MINYIKKFLFLRSYEKYLEERTEALVSYEKKVFSAASSVQHLFEILNQNTKVLVDNDCLISTHVVSSEDIH